MPRPGEVSLAHNGVLFLDELLEFKKNVLEVLRQPLEDGSVTIARVAQTLTYPSNFMFVGAMNPCPCGFLGDLDKGCRCTPLEIKRYRGRLSGPLLDRIDIHTEVPSVRFRELTDERRGESSIDVKARVDRAREAQKDRFKEAGIFANAHMSSRDIKKHCAIDLKSKKILESAVDKAFTLGEGVYEDTKGRQNHRRP